MRVHRLTGSLGARVDGVQLETIDDEAFAAIDDALMVHQVVFFRDQELSEDGQRALAERFGTPSVFPLGRHFGSTAVMSVIEDTADNGPDADGWHTDITWIEAPPKVAILAALVIPPFGGDTLWADLYGAYDRLSPTMRSIADGLTVRHTQGEGFWAAFAKRAGEGSLAELRRAFPPVEHPLVCTHPVTGRRALFVAGGFMESIVGMDPAESAWFLQHFQQQVENPNGQVRWAWRPGDVAIWDERCTNHRALADHYPQHRMMRRCTVDGAAPTGAT